MRQNRQGFADTYKTTPKSCSGSIYDNYLSISQYYSEEILNVRNRYNCVFANIYKILYICAMTDSTKLAPKPVGFRGSSLDDLRAFPTAAKREAGHQIDLVQNGEEPDDWKPMATTVGPGAKEIRIRDEAGAFRVIYVAKFHWRPSWRAAGSILAHTPRMCGACGAVHRPHARAVPAIHGKQVTRNGLEGRGLKNLGVVIAEEAQQLKVHVGALHRLHGLARVATSTGALRSSTTRALASSDWAGKATPTSARVPRSVATARPCAGVQCIVFLLIGAPRNFIGAFEPF